MIDVQVCGVYQWHTLVLRKLVIMLYLVACSLSSMLYFDV